MAIEHHPPPDSPPTETEPVPGREPIDFFFAGSRQQLTELSAQADLKANIIITTSSVVLTVALSRINDSDYRISVTVLAIGVLGALAFAIVAVIPKFRVNRSTTIHTTDGNPLFFGHVANTPIDVYREEMIQLIRSDEAVYRAMIADIHAQSAYLIRAKYRWLRISYILLLAGFVGAAAVRIPVGF